MAFWLIAGGLLALFVRRIAWGYPKLAEPYQVLGKREVSFICALAEANFPKDGEIPVSGLDADLPRYLDDYLTVIPSTQRLHIRLLMPLYEHETLIFPARGRCGRRRFSSLTAEQRVCVLRRWSESRFYLRRLLFTALRAVITFGYLADHRVVCHLNLAPLDFETPVCFADLLYPPIGEPLAAIAYTEADLTPPSDGSPLDLRGAVHPDYREASS
jgi:hypothetical protein